MEQRDLTKVVGSTQSIHLLVCDTFFREGLLAGLEAMELMIQRCEGHTRSDLMLKRMRATVEDFKETYNLKGEE
jgi:hypothetical protein